MFSLSIFYNCRLSPVQSPLYEIHFTFLHCTFYILLRKPHFVSHANLAVRNFLEFSFDDFFLQWT